MQVSQVSLTYMHCRSTIPSVNVSCFNLSLFIQLFNLVLQTNCIEVVLIMGDIEVMRLESIDTLYAVTFFGGDELSYASLPNYEVSVIFVT